MEFLANIEKTLDNSNTIESILIKRWQSEKRSNISYSNLQIPEPVLCFYEKYDSLKINKPRYFEILALDKTVLIDNKYLLFSFMNTEKIAFDISYINSAKEWDIVSISSKYIITKTFSSYLTNKMWAWIDRGREVWKDEY